MALRSRTRGRDPRNIVMGFLTRIDAEIVEFTPVHMEAAAEALLRYGKGR
ncbi:MAG: type II toxin-antitoxin system VapC family toxin [Acidobacteria bacterium]|nr:type II toxin-antitoxin system VapC family toxin [Acidobacteriota bacterium]